MPTSAFLFLNLTTRNDVYDFTAKTMNKTTIIFSLFICTYKHIDIVPTFVTIRLRLKQYSSISWEVGLSTNNILSFNMSNLIGWISCKKKNEQKKSTMQSRK